MTTVRITRVKFNGVTYPYPVSMEHQDVVPNLALLMINYVSSNPGKTKYGKELTDTLLPSHMKITEREAIDAAFRFYRRGFMVPCRLHDRTGYEQKRRDLGIETKKKPRKKARKKR